MIKKIIILHIAFLFLVHLSFGQVTKIRGIVTDAGTKEPIPFVNISFLHNPAGTVTNTEGEYFIETRNPGDTLYFTFVGYEKQKYKITVNKFQVINISLVPLTYELEEAIIVPGKNPAHRILDSIIVNKKNNNPDKLESYSYELYNKLELDLNNVDEKLQNRSIFNQFQFIFDYVDTSAITGKSYLPFFITESISDYYFRKTPSLERENIKANKISGIDNESVSQYTGKMYQKINIYDNYIRIFEPGFVSPIANSGLLYYKYYLIDSTVIDGLWCYNISFVPKRKQERVFRGNFWVHDTTFAIKEIQMRLSTDANINYINDFLIEYKFKRINENDWFMNYEKLFVDFNLTDRSTGFFGRKTSLYKNIRINEPIPDSIDQKNDFVLINENTINNDESYWQDIRPVPLTPKEQSVYAMVDSIQQVPIYKTYEKIVGMFAMYHYVVGPLELGPYYKIYSFNGVEGDRIRLGGRTSNDFSTKLMISAYGAYGFQDEKFKYSLGTMYIFNKNPRLTTSISYKDDIEQLGMSHSALTEDNFFGSLLQTGSNDKLTYVQELKANIEKEWFQGFSTTLDFTHKRIVHTPEVPFQLTTANGVSFFHNIKTSELNLNIRWAQKEKYLYGEFERVSLGTIYPEFNLNLTAGIPDIIESDYEYYKINFNISHKFPISPLGYMKYILDAGILFGDVPYPLLKLHEGNESYVFDKYSFNMMNYYEFASDKYVSLYAEHHFQGFFLNKIPLIQKLKLREVVSGKILIGELSSRHQSIMDYPENLYAVNDPYIEVSAGLENILKIFRIDGVWRLTHLQHENIDHFRLQITVQIVF